MLDKVVRFFLVGFRRDFVGKYGGIILIEFGLSLNFICVNDFYCVIGLDDGIFCLWFLDFFIVFFEVGKCINIIIED